MKDTALLIYSLVHQWQAKLKLSFCIYSCTSATTSGSWWFTLFGRLMVSVNTINFSMLLHPFIRFTCQLRKLLRENRTDPNNMEISLTSLVAVLQHVFRHKNSKVKKIHAMNAVVQHENMWMFILIGKKTDYLLKSHRAR